MPDVCNFVKKATPAQIFSCEFCKYSKSTFSYKTPSVTPVAPPPPVTPIKDESVPATNLK